MKVFVFQLPEKCRAYVWAWDEGFARRILVANCYKGAPVASWPLLFALPFFVVE